MKSIEDFVSIVQKEINKYNFPEQPEGLYAPLDYFLKIGGKRLRPVLTLLGADLFDGDTYKALKPAVGIELFHNFTLVHDDIMDDAPLRRSQTTVHEKWNVNTAILSGDVLFVDAFEKISDVDENHLKEVLKVFLKAAREVCEGQQKDMDFESEMKVSESEYIQMIQFKTSVLLGCALQIGAIISGASKPDAEHLYQFGLSLGTSFQIKDDLFDYTDAKIGKPTGIDIKEQKMTLPLIHTLNTCSSKEKSWLINSIKKHNKDKKRVIEVITFVKENGGIEYTTSKMYDYKNRALAILENYPTSPYKKSLLQMIEYVVERKI